MIKSISINNYRNLKKINLELGEYINLIIEPNGFGKTNFLEAIYYTVFRNSFRPVEKFDELIGPESDFSRIELEVNLDHFQLVITKSPKRSQTVLLNKKRVSEKVVAAKIPVLLFAPHSVDLVAGEPAIRRHDLDNVLALLYPHYSDLAKKYKKVLKNRNALIKAIRDNRSNLKELNFWTNEIVDLSVQIHILRFKFFEEVYDYITQVSNKLYHSVNDLTVNYLPNQFGDPTNIETIYRDKFEQNLEKELVVGKTLYGVHKDDFEFNFDDGKSLKYSGSRGQQRIGSFIFKIAQYNLLEEKYDKSSILLIDDIFSELDKEHRENISKFLIDLKKQIFMTGAVENEFPRILLKNANRLTFK